MDSIDHWLEDLDATWSGPRLSLRILGSVGLMLQTDYVRGTKDGDVVETADIVVHADRLIETAGRGSRLHLKHNIYLDIVGRTVPMLPDSQVWHYLDLRLAQFDVYVLSIPDIVISKLKRFHSDDRSDVRAMVDARQVEHSDLVERLRNVIEKYRFDARSYELPKMVENFNTVERDWFAVEETRFELPEEH